MADQNPIKYSDLIAPDDSIEKLIGQLEKVTEIYTTMSEQVKTRASQIAASMKTISGATESGRASTKNAATDAEKLTKAYADLDYAFSDTAKRIQELKMQQREQTQMNKLQIELANSVAGSYNQLSAQYRLNKLVLNNLSAEERENNKAAKQLEEETKKIYEEMDRLQRATGKYSLNVGNYTQSIEQAIGVNSKWYQGLQQLGGLFAGGFSSGVKAAGTAVAGFGKQLLALMANPIVATIAAVTAAFMALAKGISSSEENTNKLNIILAPFQRILTGVVSVLQKMAGFIIDVVGGLQNMTMWLSRQLERLPLVGNAIRDVNNALAEQIELEKERAWLQKAERSKDEANAKLARDVARLKTLAAATNDLTEKQRILNLAKQGEQKILKNNLIIAQRDFENLKKRAAQAQNDAKANDELSQAKVRLYQAETDYYNGIRKMETQLAGIRKKNQRTGGGGGSGKSQADIEREQQEEAMRILADALKKEGDAIRQAQDTKAALIENEYDREYVQAELQYDRQIEALKEYLQTEANLTEMAKKAINETIINLETQKNNKLADIRQREMDDAVKKETDDYNKRIAATDAMIKRQEQQAKELRDKQKREHDEFKEAIGEAMNYALDSLYTFMDAWVQEAEKRKQLADTEVESAKTALEAEIEARNAGYANDVETARKELELAKKNQEKAIKEQRKAQQAQEAIDTATQVSSLITATANIWKVHSSIPFVGTALAIAATAIMWGAFAAAKIKAHEVAGSGTEQYGEGTVEMLQGGSHQSGNDIDLGRKKDGTRRRAEGGEYFAIINKRNSRKYGSLIPEVINALNNGTFAEKYMGAYDGGVSVNVGGGADLGNLPDDVRQIREQGETSRYVDGRGYTVVTYKNLKTTYKN